MYNHIQYDINEMGDLLDFIRIFKQATTDVIAIDTETNGLNLALSKPFLFQFGFRSGKTDTTYTIDLEKYPDLGLQTILTIFELAKKNDLKIIGHNIKYDLHMLRNFGVVIPNQKYGDTMINIRLAHDALTPRNGGPPLSLKNYSAQYITRNAKLHEHALDEERSSIARSYNMQLISAMKPFKNPPQGYKSWTKGALEDMFKDVLATYKDLPEEMQDTYMEWYSSIPLIIRHSMTTAFVEKDNIPYNMLNRNSVTTYGHKDIKYTLEVYYKTLPVIQTRDNMYALEVEEQLIYPLFQMETVGFKINKDYVLESKERMYNYIKKQREELYNLVGYHVAVGQHALIKRILEKQFNLPVSTTGSEELDLLLSDLKHSGANPNAQKFIELIQELRTLEKWYSTYLLRFLNEMRLTNRIYTDINQVGTVSGRVTSDFQQFPKFGIKDNEGNELFDPRKMVIVSDGYVALAYLDYSQIELRLQALYTILVGHPDLNLCRAYMPYKCYVPIGDGVETQDVIQFDYNNPEHIAHAYDWIWLHEEDGQPWHPTDVHAATTSIAFPDIPIDSDEFKKLRGKVGKRVNFAKNYGAQFNRIKQMFPDYDDETIHKIDDAYYKAFPGVKAYHQYCYEIANQSSYATNLFGVRYYGLTGHKLINTLIQGSGAYFLKLKIIEVQRYLNSKGYKTRFQMNIHDELSFELAEGEEHVLFEIQKLMQEFTGTLVPIVCDLEVSTTTWSDKEEARTIEDVKRLLTK